MQKLITSSKQQHLPVKFHQSRTF